MAATTVAIHQIDGDPKYLTVPILASETLLPGAGVMALDADGFARNAADTAAAHTLGVVEPAGQGEEDVDNAAGANGALSVRVRTRGLVEFICDTTPTQAFVGRPVYWVDNQTVDLAAATTNDVLVGFVREFDAAASTVQVELAGLGRLTA